MRILDWHPLARADLAEIVSYIARENPSAAYQVHDRVRSCMEMLVSYPGAGRVGRVPDTRELVIVGTPYVAAYSAVGDVVTILRVLHGARQWPKKIRKKKPRRL